MTVRWAALALFSMLSLAVCSTARADAVGMLDPAAAQLCGGGAHHPNCPPDLLGGACCAIVVVGMAVAGLGSVFRGKAEGPREGR